MPFLTANNCLLGFIQPVLLVDSKELTCIDRHERLLVSNVQVTREVVIPPRTETALLRQVTARNFCPLGLVKDHTQKIPMTTSLNCQ